MLIEEPREITENDAHIYFEKQYKGMIVANADCPECGAKYIAWVDERKNAIWSFESTPAYITPRRPDPEVGFIDLSYRTSFRDEPGEGDLPPWTPPLRIRFRSEYDPHLESACYKISTKGISQISQDEWDALEQMALSFLKARKEQADEIDALEQSE